MMRDDSNATPRRGQRRLIIAVILVGVAVPLALTLWQKRSSAPAAASGPAVVDTAGSTLRTYEKAAAEGDKLAALRVGLMHEKGLGTVANIEEAKKWYRQAAGSLAPAQFRLGLLHYEGRDGEHDYREALRWFSAAAAQRDRGARYYLGMMHLRGEGTSADPVQAWLWLYLANLGGDYHTRQALKVAQMAMTVEQRDAAFASLDAWLASQQEVRGTEYDYIAPSTSAAPTVTNY